MPTTNPVPSQDPSDLLFNAQKLDQVVNGSDQYYTDRLGHSRRTLSALEAEFPNAAANAATATTQAGIATTQATTATTQATTATTQAGIAAAAKTAAETARDAAFVNANVYADTASGLAATTSGQQFQVVSGGEIIRYKNNSGSAVEVARYPKGGFQRYMGVATPSTNPEAATNNYYVARTPGTYTNFSGLVVGNEIVNLRYNGSAWVKETIYDFNAPNIAIGEVVSGAIYPDTFDATNKIVKIKVMPGTKVQYESGKNSKTITLNSAQELQLDFATYGDWTLCKLYCSTTGILYSTSNALPELPSGSWVLLAVQYQNGTGNSGSLFPYSPVVESNHFFYGTAEAESVAISKHRVISFDDLGGSGNNSSDNARVFKLIQRLVFAFDDFYKYTNYYGQQVYPVYFGVGTYLSSYAPGLPGVRLVGAGKDKTTIKPSSTTLQSWGIFYAENICLYNIRCYNASSAYLETKYKAVLFKYDAGLTGGATYLINNGTRDYEVIDCDFDYAGTVYIALYVTNYKNVLIERNTFNDSGTGYASHAVRIESPASDKQNVIVRHNKVVDGTTGVFFASNRTRPIANALVELNEFRGQREESISFDGFGNNSGLCPVICNGLITSATNDANGRLVITAAMKYHNGSTANVDCPVSTRTDWTTFYFSLDEGSGREGTVARIVSANSSTNEFTLETRTPAAAITIGGWCGVQSGFFDCVVRNNVIVGSVGNSPNFNYATALSIYLNVFNFTIDGNTIVGCANGINLAGGLVLSTYRTLAYNNVVKNNRFLSCNERAGDAVVRFESYYGTVKQYNNQFINNVIQGGKVGVYMRHQANLIYENNVVDHVDAFDWKYCGNTLPTANATQIGRTFMKITDDGSGNPTTIEYYVCKLSGGAYTWVAV